MLGSAMCHPQTIVIRAVSWMLVLAFVAVAAWYGFSVNRLFIEQRQPHAFPVIGGEIVTDPLCRLLNYGFPLASIGVLIIGFDVYRNRSRQWPVWLGGVLTLCVAVALMEFGARYFSDALGGGALPLSSQVWWMGSLWRHIGI